MTQQENWRSLDDCIHWQVQYVQARNASVNLIHCKLSWGDSGNDWGVPDGLPVPTPSAGTTFTFSLATVVTESIAVIVSICTGKTTVHWVISMVHCRQGYRRPGRRCKHKSSMKLNFKSRISIQTDYHVGITLRLQKKPSCAVAHYKWKCCRLGVCPRSSSHTRSSNLHRNPGAHAMSAQVELEQIMPELQIALPAPQLKVSLVKSVSHLLEALQSQ